MASVIPLTLFSTILSIQKVKYKVRQKGIMGLWITLRQNRKNSFFRDNLLQLISNQRELDGDCLILASGYFSEDKRFPSPPKKYSISEDKLAETIQSNDRIKEIRVIGAKDSSDKFNNFCTYLDLKWGKNVQRWELKKKNWHAKIAMKLKSNPEKGKHDEKIPVCAIIGSSNLTRPAYGIAGYKPRKEISNFNSFNHECDVMIFVNDGFVQDDSINPPSSVVPGFTKQEVGSIYFKNLPKGTTELEQLNGIWHDINKMITRIK
jgi:hypothetical protein